MKTTTSAHQFINKPTNRLRNQLFSNSIMEIIDIDDSTDRQGALDAIDRFISSSNDPHVVYIIKHVGQGN